MAGNLRLQDILPLWHQSPFPFTSDAEEIWKKLGIEHRIEMMLSWGNNTVLNTGNWETVAEFLKKVPFVVASELFNNEFTEGFADIVLPDTCFLEEDTWLEGMGQTFNYPFGMEDWCFHIAQAVVKPQNSRRPYYDVMFEVYNRLGMRPVLNMMLNNPFPHVKLNEEYELGPSDKVSFPETIDGTLKSIFGAEHNWEWFKKQGFIKWPKKVEEAYWRYFVNARTPIYLEYMVDLKKAEEDIFKMIGVQFDLSQFTPFISWFPCPSIHDADKPEYDLYCFSYRDALHSGSHTHEQPWLDEVSGMNPYTYNITMNVDTARKRELKDGDTIEIESVAGRKIRGTLKTMKGHHPHTIGIAACSGHWAKGLPIARGKGTNFDNLLELDLQHADPLSGNLEVTVRVKVRKVERN
jgi:molybdopterin-containing oxidoreductase family molybdopterin binding subunit